ncbi:MAG: hypothetical protein IT209_03635 [Armatimonadetes bacterium]|nr:hypothetical protein [Armatimonadota bacterium]
MNTELLNARRMTAGLLFPGRPFEASEMNRLYAAVTEQFPYQNLQHLPNGVRMYNPENDCIITMGSAPGQNNPGEAGRLQINDANIFHFELTKEKTLQVFEMVSENLNIQQFLTFGVKLTSFMPVEDAGAAALLENSVFSAFKTQLNQLSGERKGCGMRLVTHSNNGAYDLRIEPFFSDLSQLYVELDVQFGANPISGVDPVETMMDSAYQFLNEDVRHLISQMD